MIRFFVLGLIVILLSGCSKIEKNEPVTPQQMEVFNYLPSDTELLIFINLNEINKSDFAEGLFGNSLKSNKTGNWLSNLEIKTGIGFNSGISQFYSASSWKGNNAIALIFNKNLQKVKDYFNNTDNFSSEEVNNRKLYKLNGNEKSHFYFISDSVLIVLNSEEEIKNIINGKNKSLVDNKSFIAIVENIKVKNHYWMASSHGIYAVSLLESLIGKNQEESFKDLISSIKNVTLAAEFDEGVEIYSNWGCSSTKKAYLLSTAIRSAIAMDLFSGSDPVLAKTLDKLEVERNDSHIKFQLNLNRKEINQLKDFALKKNLDKKL